MFADVTGEQQSLEIDSHVFHSEQIEYHVPLEPELALQLRSSAGEHHLWHRRHDHYHRHICQDHRRWHQREKQRCHQACVQVYARHGRHVARLHETAQTTKHVMFVTKCIPIASTQAPIGCFYFAKRKRRCVLEEQVPYGISCPVLLHRHALSSESTIAVRECSDNSHGHSGGAM